MLTISQLAAYAGVTVRAVRHYHTKGLLPEPTRDNATGEALQTLKGHSGPVTGVAFAADGNLFMRVPDLQGYVDARILRDAENNSFGFVGLKSFYRDDEIVLTRRERGRGPGEKAAPEAAKCVASGCRARTAAERKRALRRGRVAASRFQA